MTVIMKKLVDDESCGFRMGKDVSGEEERTYWIYGSKGRF